MDAFRLHYPTHQKKKTTRLYATATASRGKQLQQAGPSCASAADAMEERKCRADESDVSTTGKKKNDVNNKAESSKHVTHVSSHNPSEKTRSLFVLAPAGHPRQPHPDQHWANGERGNQTLSRNIEGPATLVGKHKAFIVFFCRIKRCCSWWGDKERQHPGNNNNQHFTRNKTDKKKKKSRKKK